MKLRTEKISPKYPKGDLSLIKHNNPEKYISEILQNMTY